MKGAKFLYTKNGAYVKVEAVSKPPSPVPSYDTIALRFRKPKYPSHNWTMYMRPDEAVATAAGLLTAAWHEVIAALQPKPKRKMARRRNG